VLKGVKISLRLTESLKRALEARAKADEETEAEIHRLALKAYLFPKPRLPARSD